MRNDRDNMIVNMTFRYAVEIVEFCELLEEQKKFVIARQLLKSATSVGANIREAQNAESKADFIHKFKIAAKECDETIYWLEICKEAKTYSFDPKLLEDIQVIMKIISKIIASSKSNFQIN